MKACRFLAIASQKAKWPSPELELTISQSSQFGPAYAHTVESRKR
jgi:hypothetical protein